MSAPRSVYAAAGIGRGLLRSLRATVLAGLVVIAVASSLAAPVAAATTAPRVPHGHHAVVRARPAAVLHTYRASSQRLSSFATTVAPTVHGRARPGHRLLVEGAVVQPSPAAVRFQWLRDGRPIKGATRRTHRVVRADAGRRISVRVTFSKRGYAPLSEVVGRLCVQGSGPPGDPGRDHPTCRQLAFASCS